ncbi:type I-E CRISPR-associated protein Cse2/CasB [Marinobacterium arenosum]|uniref:type I-E CRISPR-associated protein Cse2/CasB n=1 Tax=Marinobacterium arenosum TaxID=2862496 RepID=UPI001C971F74|nr:type I-E CRISPR-associated protein Cse2/CasB [Marinobacterium arenosum]MBY4678207.1 type I-E CRISPR-associated protein Cse2/CasB [Marinobacterium arenosum]
MEQPNLSYRFIKDQAGLKALHSWFAWLQELEDQHKGGRADRARLRRAQAPDELILSDAFFRFINYQGMPDLKAKQEHWIPMAMVAGALAHARSHSPSKSFAGQLATPLETGGKAPMSELRFSQLQKSRDYDEFYRRLLRAVKLLKGNLNIVSLADSILHWSQEHQYGIARRPVDRLAVGWAKEYFAALPRSENQ